MKAAEVGDGEERICFSNYDLDIILMHKLNLFHFSYISHANIEGMLLNKILIT